MKILLVDDEKLQLMRLERIAKELLKDDELVSFMNPLEALEAAKTQSFDIAFLDIQMPVVNGIVLAKTLKATNPKVNIIFVTAFDSFGLDAMKMHASGYISKPVTAEKIKAELAGLRFPVEMPPTKRIKVKCFGNFDVLCDGQPLKFSYSKSKEVFAYLVDRAGAAISLAELNAVLWEEDHSSYLRNLIVDIQNTLKSVGATDVFYKRHNECYIDPEKIDCDAYEYKRDNPDAIRMYTGEYMSQYPWAVFVQI